MGLLGGLDHLVEGFHAPMAQMGEVLAEVLAELRMIRLELQRQAADDEAAT